MIAIILILQKHLVKNFSEKSKNHLPQFVTWNLQNAKKACETTFNKQIL